MMSKNFEDYFEKLNNLDEDYFFEMANAVKKDTGLPYDIWLDSKGVERNVSHNSPRIKVEVDGRLIPVLISDNPQIPDDVLAKGVKPFRKFNEIRKFIITHKDILLKHWNKELSDLEILTLISNTNLEIPGQISLFDE